MDRLKMLRKAGGGLNNKIWWLAPGMSYRDVVAVYIFKGASSEIEALRNINTEKGDYSLSKLSNNHVWSTEEGFSMAGTTNGLNNDSLNAQTINSIAICVNRFRIN